MANSLEIPDRDVLPAATEPSADFDVIEGQEEISDPHLFAKIIEFVRAKIRGCSKFFKKEFLFNRHKDDDERKNADSYENSIERETQLSKLVFTRALTQLRVGLFLAAFVTEACSIRVIEDSAVRRTREQAELEKTYNPFEITETEERRYFPICLYRSGPRPPVIQKRLLRITEVQPGYISYELEASSADGRKYNCRASNYQVKLREEEIVTLVDRAYRAKQNSQPYEGLSNKKRYRISPRSAMQWREITTGHKVILPGSREALNAYGDKSKLSAIDMDRILNPAAINDYRSYEISVVGALTVKSYDDSILILRILPQPNEQERLAVSTPRNLKLVPEEWDAIRGIVIEDIRSVLQGVTFENLLRRFNHPIGISSSVDNVCTQNVFPICSQYSRTDDSLPSVTQKQCVAMLIKCSVALEKTPGLAYEFVSSAYKLDSENFQAIEVLLRQKNILKRDDLLAVCESYGHNFCNADSCRDQNLASACISSLVDIARVMADSNVKMGEKEFETTRGLLINATRAGKDRSLEEIFERILANPHDLVYYAYLLYYKKEYEKAARVINIAFSRYDAEDLGDLNFLRRYMKRSEYASFDLTEVTEQTISAAVSDLFAGLEEEEEERRMCFESKARPLLLIPFRINGQVISNKWPNYGAVLESDLKLHYKPACEKQWYDVAHITTDEEGRFDISGEAKIGKMYVAAHHTTALARDKFDAAGETFRLRLDGNNDFSSNISIEEAGRKTNTGILAGALLPIGAVAIVALTGKFAPQPQDARDISPSEISPSQNPLPDKPKIDRPSRSSSPITLSGKVWCPDATPARSASVTTDYPDSLTSICTDRTVTADGEGKYNLPFCAEAATLRAQHKCGTFEGRGFMISTSFEKNIRLSR